MRSVVVVGSRGSMGQRYCAILRFLGINPVEVDVDIDEFGGMMTADIDGFIIATPTTMHCRHAVEYAAYKRPILIEKPFAVTSSSMDATLNYLEANNAVISMVNQYVYINGLYVGGEKGLTKYDYFRHGGDGLADDCISIIALANGAISLAERSPVWTCQINGYPLSIADMDLAYIKMVEAWVANPRDMGGAAYIRRAHEALDEYKRGTR